MRPSLLQKAPPATQPVTEKAKPTPTAHSTQKDHGTELQVVQPWVFKPKGTAGSATGYTIQHAMGLGDNRRLYNAYCEAARLLAIEYLDVTKAITSQDKYKVSLALVKASYFQLIFVSTNEDRNLQWYPQAQNTFPYLRRFVNNWPFYDLLAQYLCNRTQRARAKEEELAELQRMINEEGMAHSEGNEGKDDDAELHQEAEQADEEVEETEPGYEHDLWDDADKAELEIDTLYDEHVSSGKGKRAAEGEAGSAVLPRMKPPARPQLGPEDLDQESNYGDEANAEHGDESTGRSTPLGQGKKRVCREAKGDAGSAAPEKKSRVYIGELKDEADACLEDDDEEDQDIWKICPYYQCTDPVPSDLPKSLTAMIRRADRLILNDGTRNTVAFISLSSDICKAIKRLGQYNERVEEARRWGWPVSIAWSGLPTRIMAMRNMISKLILDTSARASDAVHQRFLDDLDKAGLGRDYRKLARMQHAPMLVYRNARPGYYGAKGAIIIESALVQIVGVNSVSGSSLGPLSLSRFSRYFLVPYVASHLIAQDLKCEVQHGYDMMVASCSVGEVLHPYDEREEDNEIEEVLRDIHVKGNAFRASTNMVTVPSITEVDMPAEGRPVSSSYSSLAHLPTTMEKEAPAPPQGIPASSSSASPHIPEKARQRRAPENVE